ncbi:hypothetical protein RHMOL_Rhmol07G0058800 [Rhododendron molle]|uniref:Uncharacterized protein n=1 Tax=Rhododendron molle TaxID=49168 RepID=A0ACC0MYJ4_RHOML|nr:hypothetical protein RHMOL_Rhmol07G0058800 [Rhododendron molle]
MESSYSNPSPGPPPAQLCVLLLILFAFITYPYWINYESPFEGLYDQIKFILIVSPLILLLVVHLVSRFGSSRRSPFYLPFPEGESLHRAGGIPWRVGFVLVLVFLMISYHSSFKERWFPLQAKS